MGPHVSPFLDECPEEGPDVDDKKRKSKKKKKITLQGTTNLYLSSPKWNSFSTSCRLAARAVFGETGDILSPAAERTEPKLLSY